jgi:hypothetical protein
MERIIEGYIKALMINIVIRLNPTAMIIFLASISTNPPERSLINGVRMRTRQRIKRNPFTEL